MRCTSSPATPVARSAWLRPPMAAPANGGFRAASAFEARRRGWNAPTSLAPSPERQHDLKRDKRVERDRALSFGINDHRVEIDLADRRRRRDHLAERRDDIGNGGHIHLWRAAKAIEQRRHPQGAKRGDDRVAWEIGR